jgi:selT/selW/selH-like putative selenoprotein
VTRRRGGVAAWQVCEPFTVLVEYCTARRPASSLRGRRSDFAEAFRALAAAVRRSFPHVVVRGNELPPGETPRVGAFEVVLAEAAGPARVVWSKIKTGAWPRRMEELLARVGAALASVADEVPLPDGRSPVEASVVDAVSREPIPWAVLELHAAGAAAESLGATQRRAEQGAARRGTRAAPEAKRIFRAQTDAAGHLSMRLPGPPPPPPLPPY